MLGVRPSTATLPCQLSALRHTGEGGVEESVARIYGYAADPTAHGSVLNFNLLRPSWGGHGGGFVGYREVEKIAVIHGIHLRTGGFCNPGATQAYLQLSHAQIKQHVEQGHVCWDDHDIIDGVPTGSIRISFGYMSTREDARRFVDFIKKFFVVVAPQPEPVSAFLAPTSGSALEPEPEPEVGANTETSGCVCTITELRVFPIKSCAGMLVQSWPLGANGMLFDREWVRYSSAIATAVSG